jgi:hypothetical protein
MALKIDDGRTSVCQRSGARFDAEMAWGQRGGRGGFILVVTREQGAPERQLVSGIELKMVVGTSTGGREKEVGVRRCGEDRGTRRAPFYRAGVGGEAMVVR